MQEPAYITVIIILFFLPNTVKSLNAGNSTLYKRLNITDSGRKGI